MEKKLQITASGVLVLCGVLLWHHNKAVLNRLSAIEKTQSQVQEKLDAIQMMLKQSPVSQATQSSSLSLAQEIGQLKKKIVGVESLVGEHEDILGLMDATIAAVPEPTPESQLKYVTIAQKRFQKVDVFEQKNSSSKIIGQLDFGAVYPYLQKEGNYYYIGVTDTIYGWVHAQFLKEY